MDIRLLFAPTLLSLLLPLTIAADSATAFRKAENLYQEGNFQAALDEMTELAKDKALSKADQQKATLYSAACHHAIGDNYFRAGDMEKCIAAYDAELALAPKRAPQHWQRGIALYYAGRFKDGVDQFELHQTVNSQDVENAVWHMLCAVRTPGGSVEKASKALIPIDRDSRVPMAEVYRMFAGQLEPEDVLKRAKREDTLQAQFYADLYVGLYYEAIGKTKESAEHIAKAADNESAQQHFMGDVARVHRLLRSR